MIAERGKFKEGYNPRFIDGELRSTVSVITEHAHKGYCEDCLRGRN